MVLVHYYGITYYGIAHYVVREYAKEREREDTQRGKRLEPEVVVVGVLSGSRMSCVVKWGDLRGEFSDVMHTAFA